MQKQNKTTVPDHGQLEPFIVTIKCPKCQALQAFEIYPDLGDNFKECGHCIAIIRINKNDFINII
jgi:Zn ribbon nucleic-acid-binding protein